MADETLAFVDASACSNGGETVDKEAVAFVDASACSNGGETVDKESVASASVDAQSLSGAVDGELLLEGFQELKDDRALLRRDISDILNKLTVVESVLGEFSKKAVLLEGELHLVGEALSAVRTFNADFQVDLRRIDNSVMNLDVLFRLKIKDLENNVECLEKELGVCVKKAKEAAEEHARKLDARDVELAVVVNALKEVNLKLVAENVELRCKVEEGIGHGTQSEEDAGTVPPTPSHDGRAATAIGMLVLAAASAVFLHHKTQR